MKNHKQKMINVFANLVGKTNTPLDIPIIGNLKTLLPMDQHLEVIGITQDLTMHGFGFSPDGSIFYALYRGKENLGVFWDVNSGKTIRRFTHADYSPIFSNDSQWMAIAIDKNQFSEKGELFSLVMNRKTKMERVVKGRAVRFLHHVLGTEEHNENPAMLGEWQFNFLDLITGDNGVLETDNYLIFAPDGHSFFYREHVEKPHKNCSSKDVIYLFRHSRKIFNA